VCSTLDSPTRHQPARKPRPSRTALSIFKEYLDPDVVVTGSEGERLSDYLRQTSGSTANVYWFACQAFMETDLDQIFGESLGSMLSGVSMANRNCPVAASRSARQRT
jgi:hypothetical protein